MTAERPSEQVRLEHIPGLQYITEDREQAEIVACAAVNHMFPRRGGHFTPEGLRSAHVDLGSDYVSKKFFYPGDEHTKYLQTNFIQRDATGPVKLEFGLKDWFIGANRLPITKHIEAATGVGYQPPGRDLRRSFGDIEDLSTYLQTDESPITQADVESFARRRVFLALRKRMTFDWEKKVSNLAATYMKASEAERITLLGKTVRAMRKKHDMKQTVVPLGYSRSGEFIRSPKMYAEFTWPDIPDTDVAVRGMVVASGVYDLETHDFRLDKLDTGSDPEIIAWLAPKNPGPETTEKAYGHRLDAVAYDLGATATGTFKKQYENQYLRPRPKQVRARPTRKQLYIRAHQVQREIRSTHNPMQDFFGSE